MAIDRRNPEEEAVEVILEDSNVIPLVNPDDPELADITMMENEDGSVDVEFGQEVQDGMIVTEKFGDNIAEYMTDDQLAMLSDDLMSLVESDISSRGDWVNTFVRGLEIVGFKLEERNDPWEGACGVYSPVLAEAALRFQAETIIETFPASGPVKTKIIGKEDKEKQQAAERVREDMNYELMEKMVEYRPEHERLLYTLGLAGSAFKKAYYDPRLGRQKSVYLSPEDVIVPYGESNIEHAERVTHIMRKTKNEMNVMKQAGFYRDVELGEPERYHSDIEEAKAEIGGYEITDTDDRYTVYEIHADLVIEGLDAINDEDAEGVVGKPYIVTIDKGTGEVLGIRRNWKEDDTLKRKRQHFVHYVYAPGFGFYGLGLIHICGGYSEAGTSIIRQLIDAGTLANLPGGLKSRDLRQKGEDTPIGPGEWRDVDVPSGSIRDHLLPLPYKEPSQTLLALLDKITSEGRRLGAIADLDVSDMSANAPVGTTLALLERTLKPMTAVQSRVHYAMKQEFKILKGIIAEHAPIEYEYVPHRGVQMARQSDYLLVDVIPVSDPNASTMAQRVTQYQAALQMSEKAPQIYDLPQLHRQMIETLGLKEAQKIVPLPDDQTPRDPVSENMGVLQQKPLKAFIYQDHQAHIKAHMSFMQDPQVMSLIGQSPMAKQAMASMQAHIAEHLAFSYRSQIEEQLGAPLPPPDEPLDEQIEVNLSRLVGDAGAQLTQLHQKQQAQKKAQQQMQDPNLQLQRMSEETKAKEVARKAKKDQAEVALRKDEQQRKRAKDYVDAMLRKEEIAADRRQVNMEAERADIELEDQRRELDNRVNLDLLRTLSDMLSDTPSGEQGNVNDGVSGTGPQNRGEGGNA